MPGQRGICSVCFQQVAIRGRDGLIRGHGASTRNDRWCAGANEPPIGIVENGIVKGIPKTGADSTRR